MSHLQAWTGEHQALGNLAEYFDIFNEPEGIKEILTNHVTSEASGMEDVEGKMLRITTKTRPRVCRTMASKRNNKEQHVIRDSDILIL